MGLNVDTKNVVISIYLEFFRRTYRGEEIEANLLIDNINNQEMKVVELVTEGIPRELKQAIEVNNLASQGMVPDIDWESIFRSILSRGLNETFMEEIHNLFTSKTEVELRSVDEIIKHVYRENFGYHKNLMRDIKEVDTREMFTRLVNGGCDSNMIQDIERVGGIEIS